MSAVQGFLRAQHNPAIQDLVFDYPLFHGKFLSSIKDFRKFIAQSKLSQPCSVSFWKRKLNFDITPKVWQLASIVAKETRLQLLQWKLLHNIYPTNILLLKMKVTETNKCNDCTESVDFIEHFFFECPRVLTFWSFIESYLLAQYDVKILCDISVVMFGVYDKTLNKSLLTSINYIILVAKMCISIHKKTKSKLPIHIIFEQQIELRRKLAM